MMYPEPYIDYLAYFHGPRDYFECHEVLEEYWKEECGQVRNSFWVGLIQVAVAFYHHRNSNTKGAYRTLVKALKILRANRNAIRAYGLNDEEFIVSLDRRCDEIKADAPFCDINIPIKDKSLAEECYRKCQEMGYEWGKPSDLRNKFIIHKHKLRDRSEVINERERQKEIRKKQ